LLRCLAMARRDQGFRTSITSTYGIQPKFFSRKVREACHGASAFPLAGPGGDALTPARSRAPVKDTDVNPKICRGSADIKL
jgi:hypothetical protein